MGNNINDDSDLQTDNPEECYSECVKEDSCKYWTFNRSTKGCLLKYSSTEVQTGNANFISGPKICEGIY